MIKELTNLEKELKRVKQADYVKDTRNNRAGCERTLYDLLNVNIKDLSNIALKVKKSETRNYVTIFNARPEGKDKEQIKRIRDKYGYIESLENKKKVFNASIQANYSKFINGKLFRLEVNYNSLRVYLNVYNKDFTLIDCKTYWSFDALKNYYEKHAEYLYLIKAWEKKENKDKFYKYYDYDLYKLISFAQFLTLIEDGTIRVTFRINVFKKGPKKDKIDDKGTSFEIQELDLLKLYQKVK